MARQVFIAKGLHDGILGVYGSAAKAVARATQYAQDNDRTATVFAEFFAEERSVEMTRVEASAPAVKAYLRAWTGVTVYFLPVAANGDETQAQAFVEAWKVD